MRVSSSQPDVCREKVTILTPNEFRRAYSPADGMAVRDPGERKAQVVQCRLGYTEEDRKERVIGGSVMNPVSLQPSYRSSVHHEVPLRSTSSIVFLDKSLCVSLVELEGRRPLQPALYRSALSVRLGVSSRRRSPTDSKPAKTNEGYGRIRAAMLSGHKRNDQESSLGRCRSPLSKRRSCKVEQTAPAHGVNSKADDSDTQPHSNTLGLLSFRGPNPSNTKPGRQKENADEAAVSTRSNFRNRQPTFSSGPVDSRRWSKEAGNDKADGEKDFCSTEPHTVSSAETCHYRPKDTAESLQGKPLSLKEALERFKPDFISRSQGRLRRLEQRTRRRKALSDSNPDLVQGFREDRGNQKRNCTTPDPLSDNLFKPRERSISGREMQLRSRRIYNNLPEVTRKKEEEKKRAVSQTNRLRAEVFKKRILDQILQR